MQYYEEYIHVFHEMQDEIAEQAFKIVEQEIEIIEAKCLGKPAPHRDQLVSQRELVAVVREMMGSGCTQSDMCVHKGTRGRHQRVQGERD